MLRCNLGLGSWGARSIWLARLLVLHIVTLSGRLVDGELCLCGPSLWRCGDVYGQSFARTKLAVGVNRSCLRHTDATWWELRQGRISDWNTVQAA